MKRITTFFFIIAALSGCRGGSEKPERLPVAEVGKTVLYYDDIPDLIPEGVSGTDSVALVQAYINRWAKRKLLLMKAEENLSPSMKEEVSRQLEETRENLLIFQYQRQMMIEKMDTVITSDELASYFITNGNSFILTSNIVKALFIKLPSETPGLDRIRSLARSGRQADLQQLESYCFQFAEKFDDFNEDWVPMERLSVELQQDISNEEEFLRRNTFYETTDSASLFFLAIRDYRLRGTPAPFEYVRNDIRRILWNTRRIELMQSLENDIYSDALKQNTFKIY